MASRGRPAGVFLKTGVEELLSSSLQAFGSTRSFLECSHFSFPLNLNQVLADAIFSALHTTPLIPCTEMTASVCLRVCVGLMLWSPHSGGKGEGKGS